MKNRYKLFMFLVLVFAFFSISLAQVLVDEEQYTVEELQELIRIQKQEIREMAKIFLVDELPALSKADPDRALREFDNFRGLLETMTDSEVMILLGHMYAREGDDDKAIAMFDSALRETVDPDARQMLNLVMYRKLMNYLKLGERAAARDLLRAVVFENNNSANYFPTYMYLYSDLLTDSKNYDAALDMVQRYNNNRNTILNEILPTKERLLARVNAIDLNAFYQKPDQKNYDSIIKEVNKISEDLTVINKQIVSMPGMIYINELQSIHQSELKNLKELKQLLLEYANAPVKVVNSLMPAKEYLDSIKETIAIYDAWLYRFDQILEARYQTLLKSSSEKELQANAGQMQLDKLIQTNITISLYDETIAEINEMLDSGRYNEYRSELLSRRQEATRQKADLELRREQYVSQIDFPNDDERRIFMESVNEYNVALAEKKEWNEAVREVENYIFMDLRQELETDLRGALEPRISRLVNDVSDVSGRHNFFARDNEQSQADGELITLQVRYRKLMDNFQLFMNNQSSLPDEERLSMQRDFHEQQRNMAAEIQGFINKHPNFSLLQQPGGGMLANAADLYYNLGELQTYSQPDDKHLALESYMRALQIDPQLAERDLALYNIAFISSEIKREETEKNRAAYAMVATRDSNPPANSKYTEAGFKQALDALKEIVRDFPESSVYDESVYRLGLLYFKFSEDAESPVEYRNIAINYFSQIIDMPDSRFHYDAVYQRGWVNMNNYQEEDLRKAVDDFLVLLRAIEQGKISDPDIAFDYRKDAIQNIGYCLAAIDGPNPRQEARGIAELQRILDEFKDTALVNEVLDLAANTKRNMNANLQVADFLRYRVDNNPLYLQNPAFLDSMLVLYANSITKMRDGYSEPELRRSIRREITDNYNHQSQWYEANKHKDIAPQLAIVNDAYQKLSFTLFNDFVDNRSTKNMQQYMMLMDDYGAFLAVYEPDNTQFAADKDSTYIVLYKVLAESSNDVQNIMMASQKLHEYNQKYPEDSDYLRNQEDAFYFERQLYDLTMEALKSPDYAPVAGQPATEEAAFEYRYNATINHIRITTNERFATNENYREAALLLGELGDIQKEKENHIRAIALYTEMLQYEEYLDKDQKFGLYDSLARLNGEIKNYIEAESWFRKAEPLASNNEEREITRNNILVQIQNIMETAEDSGDYHKEALERLRLASEMDPRTQADNILGQKSLAVVAYTNARMYQEAIDLIMEIAAAENDIATVYGWYDKAVGLAKQADKLNDPAQALALDRQFIDRYPSSNYSYKLRVNHLVDAAKEPARIVEVAQGYYTLYGDVRANRIDAGEAKAADLLAAAINTYDQTPDWQTEYQLIEEYARTYPKDSRTIPYLELMAKGYYDRNDMDQYDRLAKEIFKLDPNHNFYQNVADRELAKIGTKALEAYDNKDYQGVFTHRDEYLRVEASFKKEGLNFANQAVHAKFAEIQKEYDDLKKYEAYLDSYDKRLAALRRSDLLTAKIDSHITVNSLTTLDRHLTGGDKRFEKFQKKVTDEAKKVQDLIEQANNTEYFISNDRRIAAISLMADIYKRGEEGINSAMDRFIRVSTDAAGFRAAQGSNLKQAIEQLLPNYNGFYVGNKIQMYSIVYTSYHVPGYENADTFKAVEELTKYNQIPQFRDQEFVLDASWQQELVEGGAALSVSGPNNVGLGTLSIPPQRTLRLSKSFNLNIEPDLAYIHLMYPQELKVKLNGSLLEPEWVPIDTLSAGKPATTRYALRLDRDSFVAGNNNLEMEFTNARESRQDLALALRLKTSEASISASIPPVVSYIHSNGNWKVININSETGEESQSNAIAASNWNISWDDIIGFDRSSAIPIWVAEADQAVNDIVFETAFYLDTEFREATISLVAPEHTQVYLNGNLIAEVTMDYDADPFAVYVDPIEIPAQFVQTGQNTLRFVVNNNSEYRGFLSTITYSKAGKENPR